MTETLIDVPDASLPTGPVQLYAGSPSCSRGYRDL